MTNNLLPFHDTFCLRHPLYLTGELAPFLDMKQYFNNMKYNSYLFRLIIDPVTLHRNENVVLI